MKRKRGLTKVWLASVRNRSSDTSGTDSIPLIHISFGLGCPSNSQSSFKRSPFKTFFLTSSRFLEWNGGTAEKKKTRLETEKNSTVQTLSWFSCYLVHQEGSFLMQSQHCFLHNRCSYQSDAWKSVQNEEFLHFAHQSPYEHQEWDHSHFGTMLLMG